MQVATVRHLHIPPVVCRSNFPIDWALTNTGEYATSITKYLSQVPVSAVALDGGRRALNDDGSIGLRGASASERVLSEIAEVLHRLGGRLDAAQLDQVKKWITHIQERRVY